MSGLSELIDIVDDDGALHSPDSSAGFGSEVISVALPVVLSSWVSFSRFVFLFACLLIFTFIF